MKKSFYSTQLKRLAVPDAAKNHPPIKLPINLAVHANRKSGIIIINYPGYRGNIVGYNNEHLTMANYMQKSIGAVIRTGNNRYHGYDYGKSIQDDLREVINFALTRSDEICGKSTPSIYLMGYSAGASASAAVAHEFPQVEKILLLAPSSDAGVDSLTTGLANYTGEIYIVGADNDEVVGPKSAPRVAAMVKSASAKSLVMLPNCDHEFSGRENGMILSKAPLWAFLGEQNFPSTEGGIELY